MWYNKSENVVFKTGKAEYQCRSIKIILLIFTKT